MQKHTIPPAGSSVSCRYSIVQRLHVQQQCTGSLGTTYTSLGFSASTLMLRSPAGQKHLLVLLMLCASAPAYTRF